MPHKNTKADRVYTTEGAVKPKIAVTFDEHYFPAKMDWNFSRNADVMNSVAPYAPDTDDPFYPSCGMPLPLLTFSSPAPSTSGADEPGGETSVSGGEEDSAVDEMFEDAEPSVVKDPVLTRKSPEGACHFAFNVNQRFQSSDETAEPRTYKQAMDSPQSEHWQKAIETEMNSLREYGLWEYVPRPVVRRQSFENCIQAVRCLGTQQAA
ncbi:hypothetical protein TRICI_005059 [Trichomonascus ciferrii]|uniref:Reverse transcriptase Ty1/copia-type domain-containing protein n=1 Tax=Trichomonascus ciferrii TaxID=44093 RepID=A0A642UWH2_9ASCO|nr:hypothetical protein TRICI_005059 [Trichomonascus ciferrii]